jgi:hypothetical protein
MNNGNDLEILKSSTQLGELLIKPVPKELAKKIIVENHYSHKWNDGGFGKFNYGIFFQSDPERCLGVSVFGFMKNPNAKIFEHPNDHAWMCELNRLWISDELGMNAETILIAASFKLLKRQDKNCVAVQSFADGRLGCGTIYKASNFKYFGYHYTKFLENSRTGEITHQQVFTNTTSVSGFVRNNIAYLLGDLKIYQVKTYRYIYPLCRHFKFTLKKQQPYPPYDKGLEKVEWVRDDTLIKDRLVKMIYTLK